MPDVVIVAAARTPFGKLGGGISALPAPYLGAAVISEVLKRSQVAGADVDLCSGMAQGEATIIRSAA